MRNNPAHPCGQVESPLPQKGAPLPLPERDEVVVVGVQERELLPALHVMFDILVDDGVRGLPMASVLPSYDL